MTNLSVPDGDLVLRSQRGDREAFTALTRRHQALAHGLAYHRLGNFEDARDAAQSGFVRAYQDIGALRDAEAFAGWLRRIVENECSKMLRGRKPLQALDERLIAPESDLIARIELEAALAKLSEPDRLVLTMFLFQDKSLQDVAAFIGTTKDAVMSRLRHARARLRKDLLTMAETNITNNRLPENWAETLPIPYDEYNRIKGEPELLSDWRRNWLLSAFPPGTEILETIRRGYPWESAHDRPTWIRLQTGDGQKRLVEIRTSGRRGGIELESQLLPLLKGLGTPVPTLVLGPTQDPAFPNRGPVIAVEPIESQTAIDWCLARDVVAIEKACETILDAAELLATATNAVNESGMNIERSTLAEELERIVAKGGPWMGHKSFREATVLLKPIVESIDLPLVLTDSGAGPNVLVDEDGAFAGFEGVAWARIEDPHYAVTKYWTYDCWPLRRAGFVERYLVRHGLTLQDLAPRLAVRALATLQREIPLEGGDEGYRAEMLCWLEKGMDEL